MDKKEYKRIFLIQQIFATVFSLANKLQSKGDNCCKEITVRQMMAIVAIIHIPCGKATINNIAKKLSSSKQSTKHIIDSLEKKNYVSVEHSQLDKRSVNVRLTETGKQISLKTIEVINKFFYDISTNLNIQDMETLWNLLKKLYSFDGNEMDGFEEEAGYRLLMKEGNENYEK